MDKKRKRLWCIKSKKKKSHNLTAADFGRLTQHVDAPETRSDEASRPSTSREAQSTHARFTVASGCNVSDIRTGVQPMNSRGHRDHKADGGAVRNKANRKGKVEPATERLDPASLALEAKRGTSVPVGLQNMGNTCYFNAVLQNLCQTLLLKSELRAELEDISKLPVTQQLMNFFEQSTQLQANKHHSVQRPFQPFGLFKALHGRSERFIIGRQQDSYELLRHLLEAVKEEHIQHLQQRKQSSSEVEATHNRQLTVVDSVFGGHYLTIFHCESCKMPYHLFEPFLDMSLPIAFENEERRRAAEAKLAQNKRKVNQPHEEEDVCEQDSVKKPQRCAEYRQYVAAVDKVRERLKNTTERPEDNSLLNCLRFYTREEHLDEYFCVTCNEGLTEPAVQKGTKQTLIFNPPAVLTIHLRRFEQSSRGYVKVAQHITFKEDLDLAPYCTRLAWRQQPAEDAESFQYRLYGVVVHGGYSLESGHYTACVKLRTGHVDTATTFLQKTFLDRRRMMSKEQLINLVANDLPRELLPHPTHREQDQWFHVSDTSVRRVRWEHVSSQEAYLLFYERIR